MAEIKAFVAYSYAPADTSLIRIFTDHFDTLAHSLAGFSWEHARWAEAEPVSSKVLEKFEGKNTLIAICTRAEYVVSPEALSRFVNIVGLRHLEWKTSDWIIQEIGLAIGRGMKVMVLLENGVRKPGGLFGDVEFVPFSRETPQASFDSLLQMLSISPKSGLITAADTKPATLDKKEKQEESENTWDPRPEWDQKRYNRAAFRAIVFRRDPDFAVIDNAYRKSTLIDGIGLTVWEAQAEYLHIIADESADFEKIKKAARAHPENLDLSNFLAHGYAHFGQFEAAAQKYESIAANAANDVDKMRFLVSAAWNYARAGQAKRSREITEVLKRNCTDDADLQYDLLQNLKDFAASEKEDVLELAIMERMVELRPSVSFLRFGLAYKHSQFGNSDMALRHYTDIPWYERDSTAWNNLGVAYGQFDMPIKAVAAYRESEGKKETLAMCNLGVKLLAAGFLPEAQDEANKTLGIEPRSENVPELLRRLNDDPKAEEKKLGETLEGTSEKARFYRKLGESVLRPTPTQIVRKWRSPEGLLDAEIGDDSIRLFGTQERRLNLLAAVGAGQTVHAERVEYSGRLRGSAFFGQVTRKTEGASSVFGSLNNSAKTAMFFNADKTELSVMEGADSLRPKFYALTPLE